MMLKTLFSLLAGALLISVFCPSAIAGGCTDASKLSAEAAELISDSPAYAEEKMEKAVELCSASASLRYNYAMALYELGKMKPAASQLETALKIRPGFTNAMNALAYINLTTGEGDFDRAVSLISKALELEPENREFKNTFRMADVDVAPITDMIRRDAVAVIIGNRNYENADLSRVEYARHDAEVIREYLIKTMGYRPENIMLYNDADNATFKKLFGDDRDHRAMLFNKTKKNLSDIFIYYSGHGAPDTNSRDPYLVPANGDPSAIRFTGYSLETFNKNLSRLNKEKKPKSITVVLDACFSGGSHKGMIIPDASPIFIEVVNPLVAEKNSVIFSSSSGKQISSWYPERKHGLFTYHFLKAIKKSVDGKRGVTAADIEKTLNGSSGVNDDALRLYQRTQTPEVSGNREIILVTSTHQ